MSDTNMRALEKLQKNCHSLLFFDKYLLIASLGYFAVQGIVSSISSELQFWKNSQNSLVFHVFNSSEHKSKCLDERTDTVVTFLKEKKIPYVPHYNMRLVYLLPHF